MKDIAKNVHFTRWHNPEVEAAIRALTEAQERVDNAKSDLAAMNIALGKVQKAAKADPASKAKQSAVEAIQSQIQYDEDLLVEAEATAQAKQEAYARIKEDLKTLQGIDLDAGEDIELGDVDTAHDGEPTIK
jgi:hypothetical protein